MDELKLIKETYGEKFSHLCRGLFPSVLENEGLLWQTITSIFAPTKSLYEDLEENNKINDFYNLIIIKSNLNKIEKEETLKSPEELLDEAGYILYPECKSEKEIQSFRHYYAEDEELCTFVGGRLNTCRVWFAVKKNVDQIKREDFKNPQRQDEYGTSVISIQFSKSTGSLSIKNRYNHTVQNPDATFSNNLELIARGLTNAFYKKHKIKQSLKYVDLYFDNYTQANDGLLYRTNFDWFSYHFCNNNIVLENGYPKTYNKDTYILCEDLLIDLKNKSITSLSYSNENLVNTFGEISNIFVKKQKNGIRDIIFKSPDKEDVTISINKNNEIIGYINNNLTEVDDNFLEKNKKIKYLEMNNLEIVGNRFLNDNLCLENVYLPKLKYINDHFLHNNRIIKEINLPNVEYIRDSFLYVANRLQSINTPKLKVIGNDFLKFNYDLTNFEAPLLYQVGDKFLHENNSMKDLNLPKLKLMGSFCLYKQTEMNNVNLPQLEEVGDGFLTNAISIKQLNLPKLRLIGGGFMFFCKKIIQCDISNIKVNDDMGKYIKSLTNKRRGDDITLLPEDIQR